MNAKQEDIMIEYLGDRYLIAIEVDEKMYRIIAEIKDDIKCKRINIPTWRVFFESSILSFLKMAENNITPFMFDRFIERYRKKDNMDA